MARSTDKDERLRIIIALKIQQIRTKKGFSQMDIALALNLSRPTIANIEGAKQVATIDFIWKLSYLLDCQASDFLPKIDELAPDISPITMTTRLLKQAKLQNRLEELNKKSQLLKNQQ